MWRQRESGLGRFEILGLTLKAATRARTPSGSIIDATDIAIGITARASGKSPFEGQRVRMLLVHGCASYWLMVLLALSDSSLVFRNGEIFVFSPLFTMPVTLIPATPADMPLLTSIHPAAFQDAVARTCFLE